MPGFTDIHSHILPGLDDGPDSIEESLRMMEIAREDGIVSIVATPHVKEGMYNNGIDVIEKGVALLRENAEVPEVLVGADVHISINLIKKIKDGGIPLLNKKRYLLLELPPFSLPSTESMNELFGDLRQLDIHPILTHPERNAMLLHNVKVLANYVKNGMYCQVTAMSITGEFGKSAQNFTKKLFKKGLVHVVATDAHDSKKRPPVLSAAYEKIKREFSDDTARRVFITNPLKIVRGEEIE